MTFRACTREDPWVRTIRETYRANVVITPREDILPLHVVARRDQHVEVRGRLAPILDTDADVSLPEPIVANASDVSGMASSEVTGKFGIALTTRFLAALGIPAPGGELETTVSRVGGLTFEVRGVKSHSIDVSDLGLALNGHRLRVMPSTAIFLDDSQTQMQIITRTLVSPQIAVRSAASHTAGASASVDAIAEIFGKVGGSFEMKRESQTVVSFTGSRPITFAVAAIPCNIQGDRTFTLGLEVRDMSFADGYNAVPEPFLEQYERPLIDSDGLLAFDDGMVSLGGVNDDAPNS
jgi:hypothetical protein